MAMLKTILIATLAAAALAVHICETAPLVAPTDVNPNSTIQHAFASVERQLKRFSDLSQVITEFTKPCIRMKNVSLALANYCVNYVSDRVARATSYGAMGGDLTVEELWSINNRTVIFVQTIQQAFKERGLKGALKAFAEIKDFLDMDETTIRQIAADLQDHVEHSFVAESDELQKRWPQDAEWIQDAERMLRPELHAKLRELLRLLGLAQGPVKKLPKFYQN